jgi:hypothetical protein
MVNIPDQALASVVDGHALGVEIPIDVLGSIANGKSQVRFW